MKRSFSLFLFLKITVELLGVILADGLLNVQNLHLYGLAAKLNLDDVTFTDALATLSLTSTRPASQASLATVLRLISREIFKYLSRRID
jgi:hypothetical protein